MTRIRTACLAVLAGTLFSAPAAVSAEQEKFVCSRDVWVSTVGEEADHSMGKTPTLKLKTIQEMAILDFDLSALKGKKVSGGWLYFHVVANPEELARAELPSELFADRKHLLKRIGLSTVSADWVEGNAAVNYTLDKDGFGATFCQASYTKRPWAWPGSDLTDVTFSNGNTLQCHGELEDQNDLWVRMKVNEPMIASLICQDGFGWCIMDEIGYALANNFIHSREQSGFEPYLVVELAGEDSAAPAAPTVKVAPAPDKAHMDSGAVAIDLAGPKDAFCYFLTVNGQEVPRWRVPHPAAGQARVVLDDRKGGEAISVEAVACDAAGNRSAAAKATGLASAPLAAVPTLPPSDFKPAGGDPPLRSGRLRVWALPEICKVKPTNGALFEAEDLKADEQAYRRANSVWDGATGTIRTFGAKGEIVAFQLCLERADASQPLENIAISLEGLSGPGKIPAKCIRLFRLWYNPMPEYLVPMAPNEKLEIPNKENKLRWNQLNQLVYVDIAIPQAAQAGDYNGKITVSAEGVQPFELPVRLKVYDFAIPDKIRFNPELNIYQAPARMASPAWFECFRVAHYNRCTLSITQSGHSDGIKTPLPLAGSGAQVRVADWSGWDKAFGPLLDGSVFRDLPRSGVPLATCQVPMSHGYPLPLDQYHLYNGPKRHKSVDLVHALLTGPVEDTFSPVYKQGFANFARQIVGHFEGKGWRDTYFMFYLDAKVQWRIRGGGTSYWTLDEPYNYDDWQALRFWGKLWHDSIAELPKKARWGYRCDISRPQWTRDWLNGVMTTMHVGGLANRIRRAQIMAEEGPMDFYSYGACNRPEASNWNSAAWCLTTFLAGGEGVLPWQSLGKAESLSSPDPQGLIVPEALGHGALASVRIAALRRGAQDCEYLLTLAERRGLNREQLRTLVAQKIASQATLKQINEDDAAPLSFSPLDPDKFAELREGIAKLIVADR